jgi:hypothetical protein
MDKSVQTTLDVFAYGKRRGRDANPTAAVAISAGTHMALPASKRWTYRLALF